MRIGQIFLTFGVCYLIGGAVQAQTTKPKKAANFVFSCASWEKMKGEEIYYLPEKLEEEATAEDMLAKLKAVDVPEMTRSNTYEYKGGSKISFYRKSVSSKPESKTPLRSIASVSVPSDWKKVLFVFFPGKKRGEYKIFPIRDERKFAPYGAYQFVNLSTLPLSGIIDKRKLSVKPKGKSIVQLRGSKSRSMNFGVWAEVNGKKQWLQRNTLTYKPNKYLIYFFYPSKDSRGQLKLKSKGIVSFKPTKFLE